MRSPVGATRATIDRRGRRPLALSAPLREGGEITDVRASRRADDAAPRRPRTPPPPLPPSPNVPPSPGLASPSRTFGCAYAVVHGALRRRARGGDDRYLYLRRHRSRCGSSPGDRRRTSAPTRSSCDATICGCEGPCPPDHVLPCVVVVICARTSTRRRTASPLNASWPGIGGPTHWLPFWRACHPLRPAAASAAVLGPCPECVRCDPPVVRASISNRSGPFPRNPGGLVIRGITMVPRTGLRYRPPDVGPRASVDRRSARSRWERCFERHRRCVRAPDVPSEATPPSI